MHANWGRGGAEGVVCAARGSSVLEAKIRKLDHIFESAVQLQVPLYQRPYVWEKGRQWEPLWADVRAVAEQLHEQLAANVPLKKAQSAVTPHFMGAVVLQQVHTAIGEMERYAIIDGQQRLTTLQLLLDAAQAVLDAAGEARVRRAAGTAGYVNTRKVKARGGPVQALADERGSRRVPRGHERPAAREARRADPREGARHGGSRLLLGRGHRVPRRGRNPGGRRAAVGGPDDGAPGPAQRSSPSSSRRTRTRRSSSRRSTRATRRSSRRTSSRTSSSSASRRAGLEPATRSTRSTGALDAESWRKTVRQGPAGAPAPRLASLLLADHADRQDGQQPRGLCNGARDCGGDDADDAACIDLFERPPSYDSFERVPRDSVRGKFRYRVIDVMQADAVTPVLLWLHDPTRSADPADASRTCGPAGAGELRRAPDALSVDHARTTTSSSST